MKRNPRSSSGFDASWVEQYVHNILKQTLPKSDLHAGSKGYDVETTETRQHVTVKVYVSDPSEAKRLQVEAAATQIRLSLKDRDAEQRIQLPHPVIPSSCRAVYKDGVLQLQLRKQEKEELFYNINVQFV